MSLLNVLIAKKLGGSGGGEDKYVHVAGTTPSIAAQKDTTYICDDTVTALTISSMPSEGLFGIIFEAGATEPQITAPAYVVYHENSKITKSKINELSYQCFSLGVTQCAQGVICEFDAPT